MRGHERAVSYFKKAPTDAYWALRVCEQSYNLRDRAGRSLYAHALACVAARDPELVVEDTQLGVAHKLGLRGIPAKTLRAAERLLRVRDRSLAAHVKGKLWVAAMSGHGDPKTLAEFGRAAVAHLARVAEPDRTASFHEAHCVALAWADYKAVLANFEPYFASAPSYAKDSALILVLQAATRNRDWKSYDRYRVDYAQLPPEGHRAHKDCEVLNCDGLRALAKKDVAGAHRVLLSLIERGRNVQFLGTPDTLVFVKALAKRGLLRKESREFLLLASADGKAIPPTFTEPLRELLRG